MRLQGSDLRRTSRQSLPARRQRRALLRCAFSNWRLPANVGSIAYRLRSVAPWLFHALMKHRFTMRTRSGSLVEARLRDLDAPAEIFGLGEYDFAVIDWAQVEYVLDLGAHVGSFIVWAAERTGARFLAVEPNPDVIGLLTRNVAGAGLSERVQIRQAAVGAESGQMWLIPADDTAATSVRSDGTGPPVEVATLDEVFDDSGFPRFDVLKMDIEGLEYVAVGAASEGLLERVGVAVIECHGRETDAAALTALEARFHGAGFSIAVEPKSADQALLIAWH